MAKKAERDTASLTVDLGNRERRGLEGRNPFRCAIPMLEIGWLSAAAAEPALRSCRQVPILVLWQA